MLRFRPVIAAAESEHKNMMISEFLEVSNLLRNDIIFVESLAGFGLKSRNDSIKCAIT